MKTLLPGKPSPAMVIALIALCVAASGTAIAASKLVSGDKLIAKKSLSGNRLRDHTISGKQINLSKLGKVPRAKNADHAATAANATEASDARTVGHQAPSAFVPASRFLTSRGLLKLTGAASPGHKQTLISSGPFTVTLTCTKSGGSVSLSLDASSTEANSDIDGTLEPAQVTNSVDSLGPSTAFADDHNTNIDLAAPSGATLDVVESVGINSLGSDCWTHFFGFH
jgi:hypothetical protein